MNAGDKTGELALRMPAEWELHAATWLAWPHEQEDWPGKFEPVRWVYGEIIRHLAAAEQVCILVRDDKAEKLAQDTLRKCHVQSKAVRFLQIGTDRSWTRDYCPIF